MRRHPAGSAPTLPRPDGSLTAAVQPLLEHVAGSGNQLEPEWVSRAWALYETPEVRFAARQYSAAFSSAKFVLGRREVVGRDPVPITEPKTRAESKAYELLQTFAGGPDGQTEFLDRVGTYFVVPGDMVYVGAYDPARMAESKFAKWDVWSTGEVRWDGQKVLIQTEATQDRFQEMPDYIKHVRAWNRHPRRGWEADSPVRSALSVLELIGLYDDRLAADAVSRLLGAGVWMIPQGMKLPTSTGDPAGGTPNDFLRLLMDVASASIKDRRSAAARVPILVEAAAEDIAAAKDSLVSFATDFDERIGELQKAAIGRWATGVDLPAEVMLGLAQATHWNSSLITEDKVQSFIIPSLRRVVGGLTAGWLQPALREFSLEDQSLVLWFDPAGIKTRVDLGDEAQWARDRFMIDDPDTRYAMGLGQSAAPQGEALKTQMLLSMAQRDPAAVPYVLNELGIQVSDYVAAKQVAADAADGGGDRGVAPAAARGANAGRQGPQPGQDEPPAGPGRTAQLSTRSGG